MCPDARHAKASGNIIGFAADQCSRRYLRPSCCAGSIVEGSSRP
jgi:hypothetical protein